MTQDLCGNCSWSGWCGAQSRKAEGLGAVVGSWGSAPVPRKESSMKAGSYLCLTQPAERLCVMRVYNSEDRLSLSAPTVYFFFISKVRINFFQIIHKRKCYCQQLSSFPNNYISHPQDSKIISSQKSYPKDKSE